MRNHFGANNHIDTSSDHNSGGANSSSKEQAVKHISVMPDNKIDSSRGHDKISQGKQVAEVSLLTETSKQTFTHKDETHATEARDVATTETKLTVAEKADSAAVTKNNKIDLEDSASLQPTVTTENNNANVASAVFSVAAPATTVFFATPGVTLGSSKTDIKSADASLIQAASPTDAQPQALPSGTVPPTTAMPTTTASSTDKPAIPSVSPPNVITESAPNNVVITRSDAVGTATNSANTTAPAAVNSAPVAAASTHGATEDGSAITGTLSATDGNNDPLVFSIVTNGLYGTVEILNGTLGTFRYTPNNELSAIQALNTDTTLADVITYKATDNQSAFGSGTLTINITGVNDAPAISNLNGDSITQLEDAIDTALDSGTAAVLSDVDTSNFNGATITASVTNNAVSSEDKLTVHSGSGNVTVSGSTISYAGTAVATMAGGTNGDNLVVTLNSNASLTAAQAVIRQISYKNLSNNPSTADRTVSVTFTDGDGGTTSTYNTTVSITPRNDSAIITGLSGDTLSYAEGDSATVIEQGGNIAITDADNSHFNGGTLTVSFTAGSDSAEDILSIRNQGSGAGQIGVSGSDVSYAGVTFATFTGGSGGSNLVISFNSAAATPAAITALTQNITYRNTDTDNPTTGTRTVRFSLYDGSVISGDALNSYNVSVSVSGVNDVPVISNVSGDAITYTQGDAATVITSGSAASISDVDSTNFNTGTLTVSFTAGSDSAEDVLSIRNQGSGAGQIGVSGSDVSYAGTLIGTFAGGSGGSSLVVTLNSNATPTATAALIDNLTYYNTDTSTPTLGSRTISVVLTDGNGGTSSTQEITTIVASSNASPSIGNLSGDTLQFYEDGGALRIDQNAAATVTDADSANFNTGTLRVSVISDAVTDEDVLSIADSWFPSPFMLSFGTLYYSSDNFASSEVVATYAGGIAGEALVITFNSAMTPTIAGYLLSYITYDNTYYNTPGRIDPTGTSRTIQFTITDGDGGSFTTTSAIQINTVNEAPTFSDLGGTSNNLENTTNVLYSIIDSSVTITDPDSADFNGGYFRIFSDMGLYEEDSYILVNGGTGTGQVGVLGSTVYYEGNVIGVISSEFTGIAGVEFRIDFTTLYATVAAVEKVVESMAIKNSLNTLTNLRDIMFQLSDGDGGVSPFADSSKTIRIFSEPDFTLTSGNDTFTAVGNPTQFTTSEANFSANDVITGNAENGAVIDWMTFSDAATITTAELANKTNIDGFHFMATGNSIALTNSFFSTNGTNSTIQIANGTNTVSLDVTDVAEPNKIQIDGTGLVTLSAATGNTNDIIYSMDGINTNIKGSSGNDSITGGTGFDTFYGGGGSDILRGGGSNDTLYVGNADFSGGDADADTLYGGVGNDTFYSATSESNLTVYGESGNDTMIVTYTQNTQLTFWGSTIAGVGGGDTGTGTDKLQLNSFGALNGNWSLSDLTYTGATGYTNAGGVITFNSEASGTVTGADGTSISFHELDNINYT